ncbi:MAG: hypothetical protein U9P80_06975, partial [Thermodesulfobacteriota bacterium]|nr:hypothetical protein [Thermodesulfobacteriota bacterium]
IATFPEILELASKRYSPRDLRTLMEMSDKELECIDDRQEIVRMEIAEEDLVVKLANNTVFLLISNSSRPLRKKMIEIFVESIDQKTLIKHIEDRKILLKKLMTGPKKDVPISINAYRKDLAGNRDIVRKYLIKKYPI